MRLTVNALNQAFNRHSLGYSNPNTFVLGCDAQAIQKLTRRINDKTRLATNWNWNFTTEDFSEFPYCDRQLITFIACSVFRCYDWNWDDCSHLWFAYNAPDMTRAERAAYFLARQPIEVF